jgi:hypothetical protein
MRPPINPERAGAAGQIHVEAHIAGSFPRGSVATFPEKEIAIEATGSRRCVEEVEDRPRERDIRAGRAQPAFSGVGARR